MARPLSAPKSNARKRLVTRPCPYQTAGIAGPEPVFNDLTIRRSIRCVSILPLSSAQAGDGSARNGVPLRPQQHTLRTRENIQEIEVRSSFDSAKRASPQVPATPQTAGAPDGPDVCHAKKAPDSGILFGGQPSPS